MSLDFDYPRMSAGDPSEQIAYLQSHLWQLTEKLNYAFNYINVGEVTDGTAASANSSNGIVLSENGVEKWQSIALSPIYGYTYDGLVRIWRNGMREAWLKRSINSSADVVSASGVRYMTSPISFSQMPPGFNEANITTAVPTFKRDSSAGSTIASPFVVSIGSTGVDVNFMSIGGTSAIKGDLMLYLAAK